VPIYAGGSNIPDPGKIIVLEVRENSFAGPGPKGIGRHLVSDKTLKIHPAYTRDVNN
jgi:hypothetical protein